MKFGSCKLASFSMVVFCVAGVVPTAYSMLFCTACPVFPRYILAQMCTTIRLILTDCYFLVICLMFHVTTRIINCKLCMANCEACRGSLQAFCSFLEMDIVERAWLL